MIQEAIFTRLSATAGLTALVPAAQMYYRLMKENTAYPAIRYFQVSGVREAAMGADPGIVHARFQFDVYDVDQESVRDVAEQLRRALERWRGTNLGGGAGLTVFDTFIDNVIEPEPDLVDAVATYRTIVEAMIHYTE